MTTLETAALTWHAARQKHRTAKEAILEYRRIHGSCTVKPESYYDDSGAGPCYTRGPRRETLGRALLFADWCEVCQGSQPLYEARYAAGIAVGVALRALGRACAQEQP